MGPTKPPTEAELKVIKWFFGPLLIVAAIWIGYLWLADSRECVATCRVQGYKDGTLRMNGGNRFDIGMRCECGE